MIPAEYETELQIVFHALGQMKDQPAHWQVSGTQHIGVLLSDTLMFQRAKPLPSDADLGNFYGLALPLIMHGVPVEVVQIESTYRGNGAIDFLKQYKVLLLTYEGQKPPSPKFHAALTAWVKAGGALIVIDDDRDPYNQAQDWWNDGGKNQTTPRELLFHSLGVDPRSKGMHHVGKGFVDFRKVAPSALAAEGNGASTILTLTRNAATNVHLAWRETTALVLRRGPFVVASGFDKPEGTPEHAVTRVVSSAVKSLDNEPSATNRTAVLLPHTTPVPTTIPGLYIDLFDAHLRLIKDPQVAEEERRLLLDPAFFTTAKARVLAASAKVIDEQATSTTLRFMVTGIEARDDHDLTAIRLLLPRTVKIITVDGKPLPPSRAEAGTILLEFPARATPQHIDVSF